MAKYNPTKAGCIGARHTYVHNAHISAEYVFPQFPIFYRIMLDDQIIMLKNGYYAWRVRAVHVAS